MILNKDHGDFAFNKDYVEPFYKLYTEYVHATLCRDVVLAARQEEK